MPSRTPAQNCRCPAIPRAAAREGPIRSPPHDPNEITGPAAFGVQGFLQPLGPLPYRIDFTNEASATAPAATVVVTQQLDPNLDLSTFQLGDIGFGSTIIAVPPGSPPTAPRSRSPRRLPGPVPTA